MNYQAYTLQELSQMLKVNVNTLRGYVKSGRLNATKIGNKYIVSEENYIAFVNGKGRTKEET